VRNLARSFSSSRPLVAILLPLERVQFFLEVPAPHQDCAEESFLKGRDDPASYEIGDVEPFPLRAAVILFFFYSSILFLR